MVASKQLANSSHRPEWGRQLTGDFGVGNGMTAFGDATADSRHQKYRGHTCCYERGGERSDSLLVSHAYGFN